MPLCYKMLILDLRYLWYFDIALYEVRQSLSDLCKDKITKQLWILKIWEYTWRNSHRVSFSVHSSPGFSDWYCHKPFCLSYCENWNFPKISWEQESVIACWDAWSSFQSWFRILSEFIWSRSLYTSSIQIQHEPEIWGQRQLFHTMFLDDLGCLGAWGTWETFW